MAKNENTFLKKLNFRVLRFVRNLYGGFVLRISKLIKSSVLRILRSSRTFLAQNDNESVVLEDIFPIYGFSRWPVCFVYFEIDEIIGFAHFNNFQDIFGAECQ